MPDDAPLTKAELRQELAAFKSELRAEFVTKTEFREVLADQEARLIEAMRDMQSEILRGFERCAAGENLKLRRLQADVHNIDISTSGRLDIVERRLFEIEKRLLLNPPEAA